MLKKLRIQRFKSIHDATLDFGRINLFIGPNGSGKSNILEAIGLLSSALSRGIDQTNLDSRGIRLSLPRLFKSAFKSRELPKTFRLEAYFENGRYECSIRSGVQSSYLEFLSEALYDHRGQIFGRSPHGARAHRISEQLRDIDLETVDSNRSIWDLVSSITKIGEPLLNELNEFSRYAIYAPQTAVMRGTAIDSRVVEPLGLTGSRLALALEEVLRSGTGNPARRDRVDHILQVIWKPGWADQIKIGALDPQIVPPQVRAEGSVLYIRDKFMRDRRNYLSPYDASEGTLYLAFVATLLAHEAAPRAFALDNVDGTLNPDLVRQLTDHIVEVCAPSDDAGPLASGERYQAFMTSHHPSALDSFDMFDDRHAIFTVQRSAAGQVPGATQFRRLRPPRGVSKEDWVLSNQGKNLSELLLEGRIPGALSAR